ncbi:hypothetical protein C8J56DRAFT_925689 [Mycena floridula]|nr:hypothetical protein C8J56DRAFT_925689 [Mycena floridula]
MASFDLSVEDNSPLITYDGAWTDSTTDQFLSSYSGSSLHTTSAQGATATINFNGTGISIYGSHRPEYGSYSISVDGQVMEGSSTSDQNAFKQLLGQATDLPNGPHTAILTNTGSTPIDIDFFTMTSQVGSPGSQVTNTMVDDSDPAMTYSPPAAWQTNSGNEFMNGTLHFSSASDSSVSMPFQGDAVAIWGTVSPDHANVRVSIDGQEKVFNAGSGGAVSALHTQTLLYFANSLGSQQHTLVVSCDQEQGTGNFLDVDAVQVFSASPGAVDSTTITFATLATLAQPSFVPQSTVRPASPKSVVRAGQLKGGAIAGIVIGVFLGLALIAGLVIWFLFLQRKRKLSVGDPEKAISSPISPELPIQTEGVSFTPVHMKAATMFPTVPSRVTSISSYYGGDHVRVDSVSSTTPIIIVSPPDVPIIKAPRPPGRAKIGLPARPAQRPPTLHLDDQT